jgi:hypothetical protein
LEAGDQPPELRHGNAGDLRSVFCVSFSKHIASLKSRKEFRLHFIWKVSAETVEKLTFDLRPLPEERRKFDEG